MKRPSLLSERPYTRGVTIDYTFPEFVRREEASKRERGKMRKIKRERFGTACIGWPARSVSSENTKELRNCRRIITIIIIIMTRIDNFLVAQVSRFAESIDLSYLSRLFLIASENHVTKTTLVSCSMGSFFFFSSYERASRPTREAASLYAAYPLRSIIHVQRVAVTRSREAGGCCHAVIRFPSHFQRPLRATRERSPVSFPLSSSRGHRGRRRGQPGQRRARRRRRQVDARCVRRVACRSHLRPPRARGRAFRATCPLPL